MQSLPALSAAAHLVALACGIRAGWRYPAWLLLMPLTALGALTYDPNTISPLWYLILLARMAAALEAAYWFQRTLPVDSGRPLIWLAAFILTLTVGVMLALHSGPSAMSHYLLIRGVVHGSFGFVGVVALLAMWASNLSIDRHALVVTLYLMTFAATQAAATLIAHDKIHGNEKWAIMDAASRLAHIAMLGWWCRWVTRPARQRLA